MSDINIEVDPDRRAEHDSDVAWSHTEELGGLYRYPLQGGEGVHEVYTVFRQNDGSVIEVGPGREDPIPLQPQAD